MTRLVRTTLISTLCVGGVIFIGVGCFRAFNGAAAGSNLAKVISEAKTVGMPVEVADLGLRHAPESVNALGVYEKADKLLATLDKEWNRPGFSIAFSLAATPIPGLPGSPPSSYRRLTPTEFQAAWDSYLEHLKPIWALLTELDSKPVCDFGDWTLPTNKGFSTISVMRHLVEDLCRQADLEDRNGDLTAATKTLLVAHRIEQDQTCFPLYVNLGAQETSVYDELQEFSRMLARHSRDPSFLDSVAPLLEAVGRPPNVRRFFGGEIVVGRVGIRRLRAYPRREPDYSPSAPSIGDEQGVEEGASGPESDASSHPASSESPSWFEQTWSRAVANFQERALESGSAKDDLDSRWIKLWLTVWTQLPRNPENWQAVDRALKSASDSAQLDFSLQNSVNRTIFPTYTEDFSYIAANLARTKLLLTAASLLRIRLTRGTLPPELPSNLGPMEIDPYDGHRLRYIRKGVGFSVYSVGPTEAESGDNKIEFEFK